MKKIIILLLSFALSSCATIMTGGMQTVPVLTSPPDAKVLIVAPDKTLLFEGYTPCTITLRKQELIGSTLIISKEGYQNIELKIESTIDACFCGNACLLGVPGIIDIVNGNWRRAKIGGLIVKLDELKTVMRYEDDSTLTVASAESKDNMYLFRLQNGNDKLEISVSDLNFIRIQQQYNLRLFPCTE